MSIGSETLMVLTATGRVAIPGGDTISVRYGTVRDARECSSAETDSENQTKIDSLRARIALLTVGVAGGGNGGSSDAK